MQPPEIVRGLDQFDPGLRMPDDSLHASLAFRRGLPADASILADLGRRTFLDQFAADNDPADIAEYVGCTYGEALQAQELADPAAIYLIAERDAQPVGFALMRVGEAPACVKGATPIEIRRFYVTREWQGRGIARPMMDACIAEARGRGGDVLWLAVWEHNPRAMVFYTKCGFMEVGMQPFRLGRDMQRDRVMMRPLGPK